MASQYRNHVDTIILGGGISGLYMALLLERAGQKVIVLEKDPFVGGLLNTVQCQGFHFDTGGHRLVFLESNNLFLFLKEIGFAEPLIEHRRQARIVVEKKFLHYPPGLLDVISLPARLWFPVLWDFLIGCHRFSNPRTFEEWLCRYYGETIYKLIFKDYTQKVWGVACSAFPSQFLQQRVGRFHWREFLLGRPSVTSKDTRCVFHYPGFGMIELVRAVMSRLGNNVSVLRSSQALEFRPVEEGVRVSFRSKDFGVGEILARNVVSTIPVPSLLKILKDPAAEKYVPAYKSRHLVLLNLILKKGVQLPPFHWVYFSQGDVVFSRAFIPSVWSSRMSTSQGKSISFEVICGEDLFQVSDADLIDRLLRDISKTRMAFSLQDIQHAFVIKYADAYPVIIDRAGIDEGKKYLLNRFPFLKLAGRAGSHSYYDIEDCVQSVRSVANELVNAPRV